MSKVDGIRKFLEHCADAICDCDHDVGMAPCFSCTAKEAIRDLEIIEKAIGGLKKISKEELGDMVYDIRDKEIKGWHGPRVENWSEGCKEIAEALKELG